MQGHAFRYVEAKGLGSIALRLHFPILLRYYMLYFDFQHSDSLYLTDRKCNSNLLCVLTFNIGLFSHQIRPGRPETADFLPCSKLSWSFSCSCSYTHNNSRFGEYN